MIVLLITSGGGSQSTVLDLQCSELVFQSPTSLHSSKLPNLLTAIDVSVFNQTHMCHFSHKLSTRNYLIFMMDFLGSV